MKILFRILAFCCLGTSVSAQKKWSLKDCVEYAMANNISVKISDVQAQQAALTYKQSRFSQLPDLNFGIDGGLRSGISQDRITFARVTQTIFSSGMQLQTSADIFNFYSKRNTIAANNWELLAAKANVDRLRNDIALAIANVYLQALLAKEQENISLVQIQQTTAQLDNTRKLVNAGSLPPLNLTQLEAQLALDSGNYITAKGNVIQNTLNLKAYMNIDPAAEFDLEAPALESIPLDPISELQPESVYSLALKNQPLQRYNDLRLKAAEKNKAAARGAMYPSLSLVGSLGTTYQSFKKQPYYDPANRTIVAYDTTAFAVAGLPTAKILSPIYQEGGPIQYLKSPAYGTQLSDNFSQFVGVNLSVPIFNKRTLRTNYERSKLNITGLQLQKEQDDYTLKQNIFSAYNSVLIALEKYNASKKSVEANQQTYDYAKKRFDVGMLNTFDLITTQNNLLRAKLEYSINNFDYVFKMKVLEFYKGNGIRL